MKKRRNFSDSLKSKDVKRLDEAIIATALSLHGKNVPFNVADLFGESEYSELAPMSIDSFGVLLEMEQFTDEEIVALVAERLEILATRPTNRLLCRAEIAGYYYVI